MGWHHARRRLCARGGCCEEPRSCSQGTRPARIPSVKTVCTPGAGWRPPWRAQGGLQPGPLRSSSGWALPAYSIVGFPYGRLRDKTELLDAPPPWAARRAIQPSRTGCHEPMAVSRKGLALTSSNSCPPRVRARLVSLPRVSSRPPSSTRRRTRRLFETLPRRTCARTRTGKPRPPAYSAPFKTHARYRTPEYPEKEAGF